MLASLALNKEQAVDSLKSSTNFDKLKGGRSRPGTARDGQQRPCLPWRANQFHAPHLPSPLVGDCTLGNEAPVDNSIVAKSKQQWDGPAFRYLWKSVCAIEQSWTHWPNWSANIRQSIQTYRISRK